jgi:hypothetical protein
VLRIVVDFHIDIELDVLVLRLEGMNKRSWGRTECRNAYLHEQRNSLGKSWDGLLGFFGGTVVLHAIGSIPILILDGT